MKKLKKIWILGLMALSMALMLCGCAVDEELIEDVISYAEENLAEEYDSGKYESQEYESEEYESEEYESEDVWETDDTEEQVEELDLHFRNDKLLVQHYEKHGEEMGFASKEDYEKAAAAVVANKNTLHKKEAEDGDDVYYLEETNEFVVVSTDGYIRTYFNPSQGKKYYDRQ